jgi:DNA adenine methylase
MSRASVRAELEPAIGSQPPLLKWVGGKQDLLSRIEPHLPKTFGRYFEPFAGGAALFFHLAHQLEGVATVGDKNADLIHCYQMVRDQPEKVIRRLRWLEGIHRADDVEPQDERSFYYQTRREWNRGVRSTGTVRVRSRMSDVQRAAAFLYLNRTCWNGLWRENRSGKFNVPAGRYRNPTICDPDRIRLAASALERATFLVTSSWRETVAGARAGDLVYLDPPYVPRSETSSFTSYAAGGFTMTDQITLASWVHRAVADGIHVLVSNSATRQVRELYAGLRQVRIRASRSINCKSDRRGNVNEILVVGTSGTRA